MSEKHLLLSSAKSGVMVDEDRGRGWRIAAVVIGFCVVAVGAANVAARVATFAFGDNASLMAFAPAVVLFNAPASTTPAAIIPARLVIPSIGVDANVQQVGENSTGAMGTPSNFTDVAWYALGPKPGEPGDAVIDGHVNNALTAAGVFEHLSQIKPGDTIEVADASGETLTYAVTQVQEYAPDVSPNSILTSAGPSQLVLITCDGDWVDSEHQFNERLVVVASLQ